MAEAVEEGSMSSHSSEDEFLREEVKAKKNAAVWSMFTFPEGQSKVNAPLVTCKICHKVLSRGDVAKHYSFSNTSLIRHCIRYHPKNYAVAKQKELRERVEAAGSASTSEGAPSTSALPSGSPSDLVCPEFAELRVYCKHCPELISYGETSLAVICRMQREHRCAVAFKKTKK